MARYSERTCKRGLQVPSLARSEWVDLLGGLVILPLAVVVVVAIAVVVEVAR